MNIYETLRLFPLAVSSYNVLAISMATSRHIRTLEDIFQYQTAKILSSQVDSHANIIESIKWNWIVC